VAHWRRRDPAASGRLRKTLKLIRVWRPTRPCAGDTCMLCSACDSWCSSAQRSSTPCGRWGTASRRRHRPPPEPPTCALRGSARRSGARTRDWCTRASTWLSSPAQRPRVSSSRCPFPARHTQEATAKNAHGGHCPPTCPLFTLPGQERRVQGEGFASRRP